MAKRLNVSFVTVNYWENGKSKPKTKNVKEIIKMEKQTDLKESPKEMTFRPIQYLGSKMRLVDQIQELAEKYSKNEVFCDLFAGSGVVSNKMAKHNKVYACDIQEYSKVITSALFTSVNLKNADFENFINDIIDSQLYKKSFNDLKKLIQFEETALNEAKEGRTEKLLEFSENCSLYIHKHDSEQVSQNSALYKLKENFLKKINEDDLKITMLYGGVYFSYKQALFIDSALKVIRDNYSKREGNFLLAAILSTASEIVNTVGKQFAQPMKLVNREGKPKKLLIERTIRDKEYSPEAYVLKYCEQYSNSIQNLKREKHYFSRMDYSEFLDGDTSEIGCFYADPPYTIDHYSRFYHVLETIARNDLPSLARMNKKGVSVIMNGLYRDDRHQSPFCIPSQAFEAFEKMIAGCSRFGAPLIISYSPYDEANDDRPRLLKTAEIKKIAHKYYTKVEIVSVDNHAHRKLHSTNKNIKTIQSGEVFIICSSKVQ